MGVVLGARLAAWPWVMVFRDSWARTIADPWTMEVALIAAVNVLVMLAVVAGSLHLPCL